MQMHYLLRMCTNTNTIGSTDTVEYGVTEQPYEAEMDTLGTKKGYKKAIQRRRTAEFALQLLDDAKYNQVIKMASLCRNIYRGWVRRTCIFVFVLYVYG